MRKVVKRRGRCLVTFHPIKMSAVSPIEWGLKAHVQRTTIPDRGHTHRDMMRRPRDRSIDCSILPTTYPAAVVAHFDTNITRQPLSRIGQLSGAANLARRFMQLIESYSLASLVDGSAENAEKGSNALECSNPNF